MTNQQLDKIKDSKEWVDNEIQRRLGYELTNTDPDFDREENKSMIDYYTGQSNAYKEVLKLVD